MDTGNACTTTGAVEVGVTKAGRKTICTVANMKMICQVIAEKGVTDNAAAREIGLHRATLARWKNTCPELSTYFEIAREQFRATHLQRLFSATTKDGRTDWRAAAWTLLHVFPKDYKLSRQISEPETRESPYPGASLEDTVAYLQEEDDRHRTQLLREERAVHGRRWRAYDQPTPLHSTAENLESPSETTSQIVAKCDPPVPVAMPAATPPLVTRASTLHHAEPPPGHSEPELPATPRASATGSEGGPASPKPQLASARAEAPPAQSEDPAEPAAPPVAAAAAGEVLVNTSLPPETGSATIQASPGAVSAPQASRPKIRRGPAGARIRMLARRALKRAAIQARAAARQQAHRPAA